MKNCPRCNKEVSDKDKFCKFCGNKLLNDMSKKSDTQKLNIGNIESRLHEKQKVSKFNIKKILIISVLAFIVILISVTFLFSIKSFNQLKSDEVLEFFQEIEDAVETENISKLTDIMVSSSDKNALSDNDAKAFLQLIKSDDTLKMNVLSNLKIQSENIKSGKDIHKEFPIEIIKQDADNKESYKLALDPIQVSSNYPDYLKYSPEFENTNIYMGIYEQELTYYDLTMIRNINTHELGQNTLTLSLDNLRYEDLKKEYGISEGEKKIEIKTLNDKNCLVFIDGKNTSLTIDEFNNINPKNLNEGEKMQILSIKDGKITSSNPHILGWESWVILHLNFWRN